METTIYTVGGKTFELRHHGVKGMKWGRRKARPQATGTGRRGGQTDNSPAAQAARREARRQKLKRAAKIGATAVAAGLAIYGAKKVHDVVRDKNYQYRMRQARQHIDSFKDSPMFSKYHGMDWRDSLAVDDRWNKFTRDTVDTYSRRSDNDSFARAARNVVGEYLLDETKRRRR